MLKNWRPVLLLCTDYKILSKCLSNRVKKCMKKFVQVEQSYCVPNRTIMDNVFLIRDISDIATSNEHDLGLLSLDQEKAFDRVDHTYLSEILEGYGLGEGVIQGVRLLYSTASIMLKVGGGLSYPVMISRGIRQGRPISGPLYSLAIEPLLCKLRTEMQGWTLESLKPITLSAYADDTAVCIQGEEDINVLKKNVEIYERAASTKANWEKSEGFLMGKWSVEKF